MHFGINLLILLHKYGDVKLSFVDWSVVQDLNGLC